MIRALRVNSEITFMATNFLTCVNFYGWFEGFALPLLAFSMLLPHLKQVRVLGLFSSQISYLGSLIDNLHFDM